MSLFSRSVVVPPGIFTNLPLKYMVDDNPPSKLYASLHPKKTHKG